MHRWLRNGVIGLVLLVLAGGGALWVAESRVRNPLHEEPGPPPPPPAAQRAAANPLRNAYFGELHLHTAVSLDAAVFGTRGGPRTAYRFARGEAVPLPASGTTQQLAVALDFAAVTDHAEGLGLLHQCHTPGSGSYWSFNCLAVRHRLLMAFPRMFASLRQHGAERARYDESACGPAGALCIAAAPGVWRDIRAAAEEYNAPGLFTTFNAFEYSPTLVDGGMLHRNVIFRGSSVPDNVFSSQDGFAEDLLRWLERECTGACRALSIPHNPNFSWGLAFGETNSDGTPLTRENLELRARVESSVEIFQAKGSSECAATFDTNDEQCGFENLWPACEPEGLAVDPLSGQHAARCVGSADMVRGALRSGLLQEQRFGVNGFKFGIIAATDNHNATPGDTGEATWNGHSSVNDATPELRLGIRDEGLAKYRKRPPAVTNPGGLAGVWAEENTREAIWDALKRRESFGTSGTRIALRMFAGYDLASDFHTRHDAIATAYAGAAPMGSDLPPALEGAVPALVVWALRDPASAPLQRIQVVKGWAIGEQTGERVYDIACSDGLQPDPSTHRCPDNGARVNLDSCSIAEDTGAAELATTWSDPDFDPGARAFYYVRVLENPVCRYSQRDALALGVPHPSNVPQTIQERAWSSPVWYAPQ